MTFVTVKLVDIRLMRLIMTIKEVKEYLETIMSIEDLEQDELNHDSRVGVQNAIKSRKRKLLKELEVKTRYIEMMRYERELNGIIAGVDEAGRGPLAGEVVAGAVILGDEKLYGLDDSKKLSESERNRLYDLILDTCTVGIGIATVEEIDTLNIYEATKLAMMRAVKDLNRDADHLLIDAMELDLDIHQQSIIKGDANSNSIAAASIIAKVYRDRLMNEHSKKFPEYEFHKNSGYGTKSHLDALKNYGATPIHRKSFSPVKELTHNLFNI